MLGYCFFDRLSGVAGCELFAFDRSELDVCDFELVKQRIADLRPDFVINCSAYTAVDDAEGRESEAFKINAEAVSNIAECCNESGAVLIHFSTDYVFDGENSGGYAEDDTPGSINVYGASKLNGEQLIAANMEKFYIIRTSWLFGPNGKNFVSTMLELAKVKDELSVVSDQIGSPTYTVDLCRAVVEKFLELESTTADIDESATEAAASRPRQPLPFGIYHLTNSGTTSWYGFAKEIFELKGISTRLNETDSSSFVRPAKRPPCSILRSVKTDFHIRGWKEALQDYLFDFPQG